MSAADRAASQKGDRVPRLAADCDPTALDLTPAQGFLLSRIDGLTPESVLLQLGGLDPDEVRRCLDAWSSEGLVVFGKSGPLARGGRGAVPGSTDGDSGAGIPAPDPELDLPLKAQEAILDMYGKLDRPYHELLGVAADADTRAVKRAYFALSKEYHPDRYFRREIGPFQPVLERVFRKIVEAYELMCDPAVRAEVQRSLDEDQGAPAEEPAGAAPGAGGAARKRPRRPLSPFSPLGRLIAQRRAKAKGFFEAAMAAMAEERWLEATGSLRLAIAFDPANAGYRERFGEVQPKAHAIRFEQLMKEADSALSFRDRGDALRLFEEALHFKPYDAGANHTAARLAWLVAEDLHKAKEYAARATESEPDNGEYHRTLGQIYQAAGLTANARRELKVALRLDPKDREAKAALKDL
jgi:curved DNA-binding protein CbpA